MINLYRSIVKKIIGDIPVVSKFEKNNVFQIFKTSAVDNIDHDHS